MMPSSLSLTQQAQKILEAHLSNGDIAIDAFAGNGQDSLFLVQQVMPDGLVYCFDISKTALQAIHNRLCDADLREFALLNQHSHAEMLEHIAPEHHGNINAIMFKFGYLSSGEKRIITQSNSTQIALNAAIELLATDGILTILVYPEPQGGDREIADVTNWCYQLHPDSFGVKIMYSSEHKARLFVVQKIILTK